MASNELLIINRTVNGLRNVLKLTPQQCYPSIQRAYIDGMPDRTIQVVPGSIRADGKGDGAQSGGTLIRRIAVTLWVWYRLKTDMRQMSVDMLTAETQGMIDFTESVRSVLKLTYLGHQTLGDATTPNVLMEQMFYVGETNTEWHDVQKGIAFRGITYSAPWFETLPTSVTLSDNQLGL